MTYRSVSRLAGPLAPDPLSGARLFAPLFGARLLTPLLGARLFAPLFGALLAAVSLTHPVQAVEPVPAPSTLAIAAASDLKFSMDEVVGAFQKSRPDITVRVTYGSSGNFFSQLANNAPFDMFFSADASYPRKLTEQGLVLEGSQFPYAQGRIVVWTPNTSKIDVQRLGIKSLQDPSIRKIAIANPQHAPYGRAAEAAMKTLGVYESVKDKLVLGENISQTAQFVQGGAADIGILALSLALSPPLQKEGRYWEVPESAYPRLEQTAITLKHTKAPEAAVAFQAFFTGPQGRAVLKKYGFRLPGE